MHIVDEWYTRSLTEWQEVRRRKRSIVLHHMQGERLGADDLGDHCEMVHLPDETPQNALGQQVDSTTKAGASIDAPAFFFDIEKTTEP